MRNILVYPSADLLPQRIDQPVHQLYWVVLFGSFPYTFPSWSKSIYAKQCVIQLYSVNGDQTGLAEMNV